LSANGFHRQAGCGGAHARHRGGQFAVPQRSEDGRETEDGRNGTLSRVTVSTKYTF